MRKPRVWVGNNKDYDLSPASVYGDVVVLFPGKPSNVFNTSGYAYQIKELLRDAQGSDYLLVSGNIILVIIMFGVLYSKFNYVNVLLFDVRNNEYVARVLPKHQLETNRKEQ